MKKIDINEQAISDVIYVAKRLDQKNLVNAFSGNISAKVDGKIYITPTGQNKGELTPEKIAVIDENGNRIHGLKETSEITMHRMVYEICEKNGWETGGVVHSHSRVLTAFAMAGLDIETKALAEMLMFFDKIPCVSYGEPGTEHIIEPAEPYLADGYRIVLLSNHGSLAVGKTVEEAMNVVEAAEAVAEQVLLSNSILGGEKPLDDAELSKLTEIYKKNRDKRKK